MYRPAAIVTMTMSGGAVRLALWWMPAGPRERLAAVRMLLMAMTIAVDLYLLAVVAVGLWCAWLHRTRRLDHPSVLWFDAAAVPGHAPDRALGPPTGRLATAPPPQSSSCHRPPPSTSRRRFRPPSRA